MSIGHLVYAIRQRWTFIGGYEKGRVYANYYYLIIEYFITNIRHVKAEKPSNVPKWMVPKCVRKITTNVLKFTEIRLI